MPTTQFSTAVRIADVAFVFEDHRYRTPIKFGGVAVERATLLNVICHVETKAGKRAGGFGSMPLGNVWSFPSRALSYQQTLSAMKELASRIASVYRSCPESGHPIDITHSLEATCLAAAEQVARELQLGEAIPPLCTLVVASAFDAALQDAFGKVHGLNCYHTYGPDFLPPDLERFLGPAFRGDRLDAFLLREPRARLPLYHLVGALDALEASDIVQPLADGVPQTLAEWIHADGLTHLKIKLNGEDLGWDVERVVRVDGITAQVQGLRKVANWHYSLDFNERCGNVDYLLEFLSRLEERSPDGFRRVQYIEQPTARDLEANRHNSMHRASAIRPVVIDESLVDLESMLLAREMGYTGVALKACKGQSQSLLLAAAAQKFGLFLCVQDLTCPGASFIHSAGLAAHVPGVAAIEGNARQYMPAANRPWAEKFPGIFRVTNGQIETGCLTGPGLGAAPSDITGFPGTLAGVPE
jgi:L-alanine-DL-glutamate epimerase-like enolase superfamily enzyme